jgi:hypothetical protein
VFPLTSTSCCLSPVGGLRARSWLSLALRGCDTCLGTSHGYPCYWCSTYVVQPAGGFCHSPNIQSGLQRCAQSVGLVGGELALSTWKRWQCTPPPPPVAVPSGPAALAGGPFLPSSYHCGPCLRLRCLLLSGWAGVRPRLGEPSVPTLPKPDPFARPVPRRAPHL